MMEALEALADGRLDTAGLLGLSDASVDALVDEALYAAEHGRLDEACRRMAALATAAPRRPLLALLLGHLEAERGALDAAEAAYAEAAGRLVSPAPGIEADIALARAEVRLALGAPATARPYLERARAVGAPKTRDRAQALLDGLPDAAGASDGRADGSTP